MNAKLEYFTIKYLYQQTIIKLLISVVTTN